MMAKHERFFGGVGLGGWMDGRGTGQSEEEGEGGG